MKTATAKTDALERLQVGIARLTSSEDWLSYLRIQSRFYRYSANNCMLIALQMPEATQVAGYRRWQELGRQVLKGCEGSTDPGPVQVPHHHRGHRARRRGRQGRYRPRLPSCLRLRYLPDRRRSSAPAPYLPPRRRRSRRHRRPHRLCERSWLLHRVLDLHPSQPERRDRLHDALRHDP